MRVNDDGVLDGAAGPIPPNEATFARLPYWKFDAAKAQQLRWRMLEFEKKPGGDEHERVGI